MRQGSPLSEEEEPYPQTPPPTSHDTQFDIASSPTDIEPLDSESPKKQNVIVPDSTITNIMCHTCTLPVTDSTCLELANHFYHKEVSYKQLLSKNITLLNTNHLFTVSSLCWL